MTNWRKRLGKRAGTKYQCPTCRQRLYSGVHGFLQLPDEHRWCHHCFWGLTRRALVTALNGRAILGAEHFWEMHHAVAVKDGGEKMGLENLETLCIKCHRKETNRQNSSRGKFEKSV